jgi:hypothetical protein
VPAAYVAVAGQTDGKTLAGDVSAAVARFEMPYEIHVMVLDDIPRNVTGKVERERLTERHPQCGSSCWSSNR